MADCLALYTMLLSIASLHGQHIEIKIQSQYVPTHVCTCGLSSMV